MYIKNTISSVFSGLNLMNHFFAQSFNFSRSVFTRTCSINAKLFDVKLKEKKCNLQKVWPYHVGNQLWRSYRLKSKRA